MLQAILEQMTNAMSGYLPSLIGAFVILIIGWIVALIISAVVRIVVRRTTFSQVLARWIWGEKGRKERERIVDAERWVG
jgi:hypothetical protein